MSIAITRERDLSTTEIEEIAVEAYVYLYPLVLMEVTRRQMTNAPAGTKPAVGPMDSFTHVRRFPTPEFKAVVRPNFDTLYSIAWLDLTEEPRVLSVPDTDGRYYLLPLYDMWTDAFAVPGKRASGTREGNYAITGPGWRGTVPDGVEAIQAPTPFVWVIGRTQTNGPGDYEAVHRIQDGFALAPLSRWPDAEWTAPFEADPSVDDETPPADQVSGMSGEEYFVSATGLMRLNRPHLTDWSVVARMRRIGLDPGHEVRFDRLDPAVQDALQRAPGKAMELMRQKIPTIAQVANGWSVSTDSIGVYGNYYLKRAIIAMIGLGANPPEDAVYPINLSDADGEPLDGAHDYVIHFSAAELPPVRAFWSVTMYDGDGFPTANPINRFAIGDRDDLDYNDDGSLDLYLQHEHPGAERESNWLPAPRGRLGVTMRLYAPRQEILDGRWLPPPVVRSDAPPAMGGASATRA